MEQQQLSFLGGETANADKAPAPLRDGPRGVKKISAQAAMDNLDLRPMRLFHPPKELTAGERTNRDDKLRSTDLLWKANELGFIELVWSVDREAVAQTR